MIAYKREWLYSRYVQAQAKDALDAECIDAATHSAICSKYTDGFYTPNFSVRVGLALLTFVVVVMTISLFAVFFSVSSHAAAFLFVMGVLCYGAAEAMVGAKAHYNSGVDNMLVWLAGLLLWLSVVWALTIEGTWYGSPNHTRPVFVEEKISLAGFVIGGWLSARFADTVMSILAAIGLLCFVFYCYQHTGALAKATTPFVMILLSAAIVFGSRLAMKMRALLHYRHCLLCLDVVGLLALYASGNYYAVRELSNEMFHLHLGPNDPLPMGWFFWLWTFAIPVVYIGAGILKRNITLIRVGVPLIAVTIVTFRHYHAIMEPETAMMVGGMVLFAASYALISYLQTPQGGFTFAPEQVSADKPDVSKLLTGELLEHAGEAGARQGGSDWS